MEKLHSGRPRTEKLPTFYYCQVVSLLSITEITKYKGFSQLEHSPKSKYKSDEKHKLMSPTSPFLHQDDPLTTSQCYLGSSPPHGGVFVESTEVAHRPRSESLTF